QRVCTYRNQPEVAQFQEWTPNSVKEVEDHVVVMNQTDDIIPECFYQIVMESKVTGTVIGDMAFSIDAEQQSQAELGIALDTAYQKQGYALEATKALVDWLFQQLKLHRIHVSIDPHNQASINLFTRAGFRQEGLLKQAVFFKGQWADDLIMAVLREEYQQG
ncbi:MAG: GNAT family N-acetyltransferase, partial [Gammaproteobacteria bacterium]|nr:GNAT family N-acetyltransferase [Gammaproteobacteria bacterium]